MALVRRTAVYGRQVSAPSPAPGVAAVPRQPSAADIDEATSSAAAEEVGAAPNRPVRLWVLLLGGLLVAAGAAVAYAIQEGYDVATFPVGNEFAALVALLFFAAAVERLLEPFTRWMPGRRARNRYEQLVADLANRVPIVTLGAVAAAKAKLDQHRADKAMLTWALATAVATVLAASGGLFLLRMLVLTDDAAWAVVPTWVDALVTGLVVGSGTKPVHDLLVRVQRGNVQRQDPTEP